MQRRTFLIATGSVALLAGGRILVERADWLRPSLERERKRLHLRLGDGAWSTLAGLECTDTIGQAWLSQSANRSVDAAAVENHLIERLGLGANLAIAAGPFAQVLSEAIRSDFRDRRLCDADRWIVSETECQVAALRLLVLGKDAEPEPISYTDGTIVEVEDWGPREAEQGAPFNVQRDGHSGLWIKARRAPDWVRFEIEGSRVPTVVSENVITTGLYGTLQDQVLSKAGTYPVFLVDEMAHVRQHFGDFIVTPRAERILRADGTRSSYFCPISDWGPREIVAGEPANPQPDGAEGIWIKTACAPANTRIVFDGTPLTTTVRKGLVTARVPAAHITTARSIKVQLRESESGEVLEVGNFVIQPR